MNTAHGARCRRSWVQVLLTLLASRRAKGWALVSFDDPAALTPCHDGRVVEAETPSVQRSWRWLMGGSLAGLVLAVGLGFVSFTTGRIGEGGTECGSVWKVSAYYAGCTDRLDVAAFAVFAGIGLSACLIVIGVMRAHTLRGWATLLAVLLGVTIAGLGPRIWRDAVFVNFGY